MKLIFLPCLLLLTLVLEGQVIRDTKAWDTPKAYKPMLSHGMKLGDIPPIRDLEPKTMVSKPIPKKTWRKRNYFFPNELKNPHPQPQDGDPLFTPPGVMDRNGGPELNLGLNFEGLHDPNGVTPPDPVGDVGENHYVQMVNSTGNSWFQIWNKQGQTVYGPALTSTIWSQINSGSIGDPIIRYDAAAKRWLMLELRDIVANELLFAISNTSDPTGGWQAYSIPTLGFPDYPKIYVWPDAYYITVNELSNGNKCSGYAIDRNAILAGAPDFQIYRFEMPNYLAIQYQPATGANWEGGLPPPAGTPGLIFRVYDDAWDGGQDQLQIWEVNVNWQDINQSSIVGPTQLFPAPFETKVCWTGLFDCIEQPDTAAPRITALESIIMFKAAYRNFGDHESIVLNHVADVSGQIGVGGDAAVRWYELRRTPGNPWTIYQQSTYAPDYTPGTPTNRFMGTISMDDQGNVGLGYSVCSSTNVYPGLRLTGRRTGDPLNQMPIQEFNLISGGKSHNDDRWGDYSSMSVDPVDGRTFWFTGEYQPVNDIWGTRIASFRVKRDTFDVTPTVLKKPVASNTLGVAEPVTVTVLNSGLADASNVSLSLYLEGALVSSGNIPGSFAPGNTVDFTFPQTVNLAQIGKFYHFTVVSHWNFDSFAKNDTLKATVRHLTSNDAASSGRSDFPGEVCGSDYDVKFVFRNASAAPLHSTDIRWKLNNQAYQTYNWTGNLAPGARDTVPLHVTGVSNGINFFYANTLQPNGQPDQDASNDSLFFKFYGNLGGSYLTAEAQTDYGVLKVELHSFNNLLLLSREFPETGTVSYQICSDDNTCYKLFIKSNTLAWQGHFQLFDVYGNVVVEAFNADPNGQTFDFCTPSRKQIDVGAFALASPVSGPSLTASEPVKMTLRNFGMTAQSNIDVAYRFQGGNWHTGTVAGPVQPNENVDYLFPSSENLSIPGAAYTFEIKATVQGDQATDNDAKTIQVLHRPQRDLAILKMTPELFCGDTANALVSLKLYNGGLTKITKAKFNLTVNGVVKPSQDIMLPIAVGETQQFSFTPHGLVYGNNFLQVELTDVEGLGKDAVPSNDTASLTAPLIAGGYGMTVSVLTDDKPQETRWQLVDAHNQVVFSGGPYADPHQAYLTGVCLKPDSCYRFLLLDSGHDGMNGSVQLQSPTNGVVSSFYGGNFGDTLNTPFCAMSACAGFVLKDVVTPPTTQGASDAKIQVHVTGGEPPYIFSLNGVSLVTDSLFTGLAAGIYTITCLDKNQCETTITVTIGVSAVQDLIDNRRLKVNPNPTKGLVWLEIPAGPEEQSAMCQVFNSEGKLIMASKMTRWDDTMHGVAALDTFPPGVYLFRLSSLGRVYAAKVVKR
jgi:hypothetical protein